MRSVTVILLRSVSLHTFVLSVFVVGLGRVRNHKRGYSPSPRERSKIKGRQSRRQCCQSGEFAKLSQTRQYMTTTRFVQGSDSEAYKFKFKFKYSADQTLAALQVSHSTQFKDKVLQRATRSLRCHIRPAAASRRQPLHRLRHATPRLAACIHACTELPVVAMLRNFNCGCT